MSSPLDSKPWLDERGKPLSEAQLRESSKSWDEKTWQAYSESRDYTRREHLADDFDDLLRLHDREEALRRFFETECCEGSSTELPPKFDPNRVARALSDLSHLEREVLLLHFWEGNTEQEIADSLEHSRGRIRRCYLRGMKKMKEFLIQDPKFPITE